MSERRLNESKSVSTPGINVSLDEVRKLEGESPCESQEAAQYRGIVARTNGMAQDRLDIMYAVKELSRDMRSHKPSNWTAVKRRARYLKECPR